MTALTHGDTIRELTARDYDALAKDAERIKWLNDHPDVILRRSLCGPWWCLARGSNTIESWTVAAVIDQAMADEVAAKGNKEASGGR